MRLRYGLVVLVGATLWLPASASAMVLGQSGAHSTVSQTLLVRDLPAAQPSPCGPPLPASDCAVDPQTGCPEAGPIAATPPLSCVPLPANLVIQTQTSNGRCLQNEYIQVQLIPDLVSYEAVWYWYSGFDGTRWWSSPGTTWPDSVAGEGGDTYPVPQGYAAWSAGGGSAPAGGCNGPPPGTLGYAGWGITEVGTISGKITTPFGDGLAGATVDLSGASSASTTTAADGSYSFTGLPDGSYTVTPAVPSGWGPDEYTPTRCDNGTASAGSCVSMSLTGTGTDTASFTAAYELTGNVTGLDGNGVQGAKVQIQDTEQGAAHAATATTDANGQFSVPLAPGSLVASVDALDGVQFHPRAGTGSDPDCVVANQSCDVNLDRDRAIEFCSAAQAASGARDAPRDLASLFSCPLFVKITQGDTQAQSPFDMTSGLSLARHPDSAAHIDPTDIVFKTGSLGSVADGGTFPGQCLSGCTDLMATVGQGAKLDPQGNPTGINDPVNNARVTATITGVSATGRIANADADNGVICTVEAAGFNPIGFSVANNGLTCSTQSVTGETDSAGQARFRYWGPASWGSPNDARPEVHLDFQASATAVCSSISCSSAQSRVSPAVINVQPQVIWWRNAHLTTLERSILVEWAHDDKIAAGLHKFVDELSKLKVFDNLKLLKALSTASKKVKLTGRASDTVILLWFIHKFGLATDGLYSQVNFATVENWLLRLVKNPAASLLAGKLTKALFGENHGFDEQMIDVLKAYGGYGKGALAANPHDHIPYIMTLKAYETSYCSGSDLWCGGPDNETLRPAGSLHGQGVHFNVYFAFSSQDASAPGYAVFFDEKKTTFNVDTGYIPRTWIPAQCRIRCVGYGEGPPDS